MGNARRWRAPFRPLAERLLKRCTFKVPWNKRGSRDYRATR